MEYPTLTLVVRLLEKVGFRVRDLNLLDAALARPQATFGGQQLYPTFELKAAAMAHYIIKNHPLFDGNKRGSWIVIGVFAGLNDMTLEATSDEIVDFVLAVATDQISLEEAAEWIASHLIVTSLG